MITTTYGIKLPEDGDKGQPVFDALNANFRHHRDHTHNGTNSAKVESCYLTKGAVNLSAGDWTSVADGSGYTQTVTFPSIYTFANCTLRFRVRTGANQNKIIHPSITPSSLTQFTVKVNDPSLELEILFV